MEQISLTKRWHHWNYSKRHFGHYTHCTPHHPRSGCLDGYGIISHPLNGGGDAQFQCCLSQIKPLSCRWGIMEELLLSLLSSFERRRRRQQRQNITSHAAIISICFVYSKVFGDSSKCDFILDVVFYEILQSSPPHPPVFSNKAGPRAERTCSRFHDSLDSH